MIVTARYPKRSRGHGSRLIEVLIVITIMLVIVVILAPKETGKHMQVAADMAVVRELQTINTDWSAEPASASSPEFK
jgi:competence protein ComGC